MIVVSKKSQRRAMTKILNASGLKWCHAYIPQIHTPDAFKTRVYWELADTLQCMTDLHRIGRGVRGREVKTLVCDSRGEFL